MTDQFVRRCSARGRQIALTVATLLLAGCAAAPPGGPSTSGAAARLEAAAAPLKPAACPAKAPPGTTCWAGRSDAGAYVLVARPKDWNGVLVVHAHGGPELGAPSAKRTEDDLTRWVVMLDAGYAWVGTSYAVPGVAVRAAAADIVRSRHMAVQLLQPVRRTVLHGQSWGAAVAAAAADLSAQARPFDAVLLTSGLLASASRGYEFRFDLRVLYQHLCGNHPRADEAPYPLWAGLPADSPMTRAQLADRARECLGTGLPAAQRSAAQQQRLDTLTAVLKIPASSVVGHLAFGTFHFRDVAQRLGGRSAFTNIGAYYRGSPDDAALNAAVPRFAADPAAVAALEADTAPTGRLPVPTLSVHARRDPSVFVEQQDHFRQAVEAAGHGARLQQWFTDHAEHSYLSAPLYVTALEQLVAWVDHGRKPMPAAAVARCESNRSRFPGDCALLPDYRPGPLHSRVTPRPR